MYHCIGKMIKDVAQFLQLKHIET